ncbi:MAG: hypothetical protein Q4G47_04920 [Lachnospiraceae bacterium]|nr:hypothetical protein [Lachnospiraceae bacterium]
MDQITKLFLYIPGIIIFLVGSGQMRGWIRRLNPKASAPAEVLSCTHVVKKDKRDNEVFNFYNVTVQFKDPENGHTVRQTYKSPTEYAEGQQVRVYFGSAGEKPQLTEKEDEALFHPIVMMILGALLILLALFQNRGEEVPAMICLSASLLITGVSLLVNYIKLKKRGLIPINAEIVSVYSRQISKETKILRGSKYTYYPVVKYELNGKTNIRRCAVNSSGAGTFKPGEPLRLYYDPKSGSVVENGARTSVLVAGILVTVFGVLAGLSILSVVIK